MAFHFKVCVAVRPLAHGAAALFGVPHLSFDQVMTNSCAGPMPIVVREVPNGRRKSRPAAAISDVSLVSIFLFPLLDHDSCMAVARKFEDREKVT